ncbi:hypothetical protein PRIPAC_94512, partial [Pristionchus pacificus]|uniref:Uncharacterized protein n=1 Tax=Pristionchus pacificus TaxID=54126 RepID=A0A2A6BA29_PRIPA
YLICTTFQRRFIQHRSKSQIICSTVSREGEKTSKAHNYRTSSPSLGKLFTIRTSSWKAASTFCGGSFAEVSMYARRSSSAIAC